MQARKMVLAALTIGILAGCSSSQREAGFLKDYSKLQPHPTVDGAKRYISPKADLAKANSFIVDPIVTSFAPDDSGTTIDPKVLVELTDYFHGKVVESLTASGYTVTSTPAPGVVRIRAAITGLDKATPALNIHPATKLAGFGLGGAAVEAEFSDSRSNELLSLFMHRRKGNRLSFGEGFQDWGHARQAMDYWAKLLVERLDEAHGKSRK